jgi:predicted RNA-binding Zn-ribbon protein involved in translation (DUF1610 family)
MAGRYVLTSLLDAATNAGLAFPIAFGQPKMATGSMRITRPFRGRKCSQSDHCPLDDISEKLAPKSRDLPNRWHAVLFDLSNIGGIVSAMTDLNAKQLDELELWASQRRLARETMTACMSCEGTGIVMTDNAGDTAQNPCPRCGGTKFFYDRKNRDTAGDQS